MYPISFSFIIVIDYVMRKAMDQPEYGIKWQRHRQLTDLDLADDRERRGVSRDDHKRRVPKWDCE